MCFPVNFLKIAEAIFLQIICKWPPLNVLYFIISQKRRDQTGNQKEKHVYISKKKNMYILKLKFYLKSCSTLFKDIINKALMLIFAFTVFLADSLQTLNIKY